MFVRTRPCRVTDSGATAGRGTEEHWKDGLYLPTFVKTDIAKMRVAGHISNGDSVASRAIWSKAGVRAKLRVAATSFERSVFTVGVRCDLSRKCPHPNSFEAEGHLRKPMRPVAAAPGPTETFCSRFDREVPVILQIRQPVLLGTICLGEGSRPVPLALGRRPVLMNTFREIGALGSFYMVLGLARSSISEAGFSKL